jgi:hypothetical protein
MTDRQKNRVRSYSATNELINNHTRVAASIPAFADCNHKLGKFLHMIEEVSGSQNTYNAGITQEKKMAKRMLADAMYLISSKVKAYANETQNLKLKEMFKMPRSRFEKMADGSFIPMCKNLTKHVYPIMEQLFPFGLQQENMVQLEKLMEEYAQKLNTPRLNIIERSQLTKKLEALISDCNKMLKNEMDPLAEEFRKTNLDFYLQYKGSREIIDLGHTYTKMRGFVTEGNTAGPALRGVKIKVEGAELEAMSATNGHYSLVRIQPGNRSIEVSKSGYESILLENIHFKPGEELNKKLVMQKDKNIIKLNTNAVELARETATEVDH